MVFGAINTAQFDTSAAFMSVENPLAGDGQEVEK